MRALVTRHLSLVTALLASATATAAIEADAQSLRPFGYTIGDVVQQTLHLQPAPGQTLIESSLPKPGRAGTWVERQRVTAIPTADGWRIDMTYQFVNAPGEVRTVALPPVHLQLRDGTRIVEETLSEAPVTLAPLTPTIVLARAGLEEMRPDTPPPLIDVTARVRRLELYGALAGVIALVWTAWYLGFGLRGRYARPFARAEREVRRRLARVESVDARRDAMRILHRAFDATAGESVFGETLDAFFARHAALAPARDAVAQFFAASRAEFFGTATADFDAVHLLALAGRLKRLEREAS